MILCQSEWVLHRLISDEAGGLDFLNEHLSQPEKNYNNTIKTCLESFFKKKRKKNIFSYIENINSFTYCTFTFDM